MLTRLLPMSLVPGPNCAMMLAVTGESKATSMDDTEELNQSVQSDDLIGHHGHRCREVVVVAMRAFLDLLEGAAQGDSVPLETVRRVAHAVMQAEGALTTYFDRHATGCVAFFDLIKAERTRTDYFGRVVTEPLTPLLNDPDSGFQRRNLPQFFTAVRMILSDAVYTEWKDNCTRVANDVRGDADLVPWDTLHADPRIRRILEDTLIAVARSFRRFAPRKDWFLIVMNNDPQAISLASNVFLSIKHDEKVERAFGEVHFVRLFRSLFASVQPGNFDDARRDAFVAAHGVTPGAAFGPLFVELATMEQHLSPVQQSRKGPGIEPRSAPSAKR
jgi:hypothetical protein